MESKRHSILLQPKLKDWLNPIDTDNSIMNFDCFQKCKSNLHDWMKKTNGQIYIKVQRHLCAKIHLHMYKHL